MKAKLQIINEQKEKGLFMANVIVIALLVLAVGGAGIAIFRKKKNGRAVMDVPWRIPARISIDTSENIMLK